MRGPQVIRTWHGKGVRQLCVVIWQFFKQSCCKSSSVTPPNPLASCLKCNISSASPPSIAIEHDVTAKRLYENWLRPLPLQNCEPQKLLYFRHRLSQVFCYSNETRLTTQIIFNKHRCIISPRKKQITANNSLLY